MKRTDIQTQIDIFIAADPELTQIELGQLMSSWLTAQGQDLRILADLNSYQGVQELN